jgi:hypothetical protein
MTIRAKRCSMSEKLSDGRKTQLALAIAQGKTVALWARDNHVPRSTAFRWASQREVRATVELCRRRSRDRALGRMVRRVNRASDQLAGLAGVAESEWVKLRALRSIFCDVVAVSKLSDLERRMAAIEEGLRDGADADARG